MKSISNSILNNACNIFVSCSSARGYMNETKMELCFFDPLFHLKNVVCFLPPSTEKVQGTLTINRVEDPYFEVFKSTQGCIFDKIEKTLYCPNQEISLKKIVYQIASHAFQFFGPLDKTRTHLNKEASKGLVSISEYEERFTSYEYSVSRSLVNFDESCREEWNDSFTFSGLFDSFQLKSPAHYFFQTQLNGKIDRIRSKWLEIGHSPYCSKNPDDLYSCHSFSKDELLKEKSEQEKTQDIVNWLQAFRNKEMTYSSEFKERINKLWSNHQQKNNRVKEVNRLVHKLVINGESGYDVSGYTEQKAVKR